MKSLSTATAGVAVALLWLANATAVSAAEIRILCSSAIEKGMTDIAAQYKKDSGVDVKVQFVNTGQLNQTLQTATGDTLDILIAPSNIVDPFVKNGKAQGEKALAGRVGIGVLVRKGAPVPTVATTEDIKKAVLAADGVIYNTAGSGQAVQKMFDQMGVSSQLTPKAARPRNAAETMDRLATGKGAEIGFGLLSEVNEEKVRVVGKLPADVQSYTNYDVAIVAGTKSADAAKAFLKYLASPEARKKFAATGVD